MVRCSKFGLLERAVGMHIPKQRYHIDDYDPLALMEFSRAATPRADLPEPCPDHRLRDAGDHDAGAGFDHRQCHVAAHANRAGSNTASIRGLYTAAVGRQVIIGGRRERANHFDESAPPASPCRCSPSPTEFPYQRYYAPKVKTGEILGAMLIGGI